MLIAFRLILFYYCLTLSLCNVEKTAENVASSDGKSDYSASDVGSYSKGSLYAPSAVITHNGHETGPSDTCSGDEFFCLATASQDRLALDAIKALHRQLDDDADGNVDLSESDEFLREDLKYQDGYQRRQQAFHRNDDKHISVRELWDAWLRSEVHNWTVEQTVEWLTTSVELPQYASNFIEHRVTGATLPRLAVGNFQYLSSVLGIKDPIHKQKIALKAMDVVLFGPPKDYYHPTKDIILVTLLLGALVGCWWAYRQNKLSRHHLHRMMKDMESLHKAELALEDLQRELEHAKKEQQHVATEKQNLEKKLLEQEEQDTGKMKMTYSDLEVSQLKQEVEMLRSELQRAEGELQDRCWAPPTRLQHWLQLTHEIENKGYIKKRMAAEKQLQQAREACEKLRKKRSSLVGAFVSTHGKSIDDVDRSIVEARTSLNEVTSELQERVYRWKQVELLCGFNIINNSGLPYLESVLYRNTANGRGPKGLGRISSSQDDLDDDTGSLYSPSAGGLENFKEDSSGSEHSKNEWDDDLQEARTHVPFILGGDSLEDDISPMLALPKKVHKTSMCRSQSHDMNVASNHLDRDNREKDHSTVSRSGQMKSSQSDSNLDGPGGMPSNRYQQPKKFQRDVCAECEEARPLRKMEEHLRKNSEGKIVRRLGKDQPEEDPKVVYIKNYRDRDMIEEEKTSSYRQSREPSDDYRRKADFREGGASEGSPGFRRTTSDDFRRFVMKESDMRRGGGGSSSSVCGIGGGGEDGRRISLEDCRKMIEKARLEEMGKGVGGNVGPEGFKAFAVSEEREETHSTDSNSTAADDSESTKKKKLKFLGHFRKNKSKLS